MKKEISFADIKNSPYLIVAVLVLFVIAAIGLCVYVTKDIMEIKAQIIEVRGEYATNCDKIAYLQSLQSQGDQLRAEKEMFGEYLPNTKDSYELVEELYQICDNYNLQVKSFDAPVVTQNATTETALNLTVSGTYESIIGFADYFANQTALHRVEKLIIKNDSSSNLKSAEILITVISMLGTATDSGSAEATAPAA